MRTHVYIRRYKSEAAIKRLCLPVECVPHRWVRTSGRLRRFKAQRLLVHQDDLHAKLHE